MTTAPRRAVTASGLTALRHLGVLLVLAGLIAMHALSGGGHPAMASAAAVGGPPAVSVAGGGSAAVSQMVMPELALVDGGAAPRTGSVSAPLRVSDEASPAAAQRSGAGAACVAVLLGMALLAARAAFGVPRRTYAPASGSAGHSSAALGRGPPRKLLAQICVLRT